MKKAPSVNHADDLRPEYDFARMKGGVRGKYAKAYAAGTSIVILDPEVAKEFPDSKSVNDALRSILPIIRSHSGTLAR